MSFCWGWRFPNSIAHNFDLRLGCTQVLFIFSHTTQIVFARSLPRHKPQIRCVRDLYTRVCTNAPFRFFQCRGRSKCDRQNAGDKQHPAKIEHEQLQHRQGPLQTGGRSMACPARLLWRVVLSDDNRRQPWRFPTSSFIGLTSIPNINLGCVLVAVFGYVVCFCLACWYCRASRRNHECKFLYDQSSGSYVYITRSGAQIACIYLIDQ